MNLFHFYWFHFEALLHVRRGGSTATQPPLYHHAITPLKPLKINQASITSGTQAGTLAAAARSSQRLALDPAFCGRDADVAALVKLLEEADCVNIVGSPGRHSIRLRDDAGLRHGRPPKFSHEFVHR